MYYAQIDPVTRICGGLLATHSPVFDAYMVAVPEFDVALVGKRHNEQTGVFDVVVTPPSTPVVLTMRQARLALFGAGLLTAVGTAINALPSPQKEAAQIEWEYSNEVQRHNGFVATLGPALGLSEAQIDALFVSGAAL